MPTPALYIILLAFLPMCVALCFPTLLYLVLVALYLPNNFPTSPTPLSMCPNLVPQPQLTTLALCKQLCASLLYIFTHCHPCFVAMMMTWWTCLLLFLFIPIVEEPSFVFPLTLPTIRPHLAVCLAVKISFPVLPHYSQLLLTPPS